MSVQNRRHHIRAPLSLEVIVEGLSGKHEARTSDISLGGCYIDAMHQVSVGEIVSLKALLPEAGWIYINGEVLYEQWPTGFGVRFTEMSDETRRALDKAITDRLRQHIANQSQLVA